MQELLILSVIPIVAVLSVFPFLGLILSIVLNLLFGGLEFGLVYPRIAIFVALIISVLYRVIIKKEVVNFSKGFIPLIIMLVCFAIWALVVDIYSGLLDSSTQSISKKLVRLFLPIIITITVYYLCSNKKRIDILLVSLMVCTSLSCIVAIMQFFGVDFFWQLRSIQGKTLEFEYIRSAGLANQAVSLSYNIAIAALWALGFAYGRKNMVFKRNLRLYQSMLGIIIIGAFASLTRSLILGLLLGGGYILFRMYGKAIIVKMIPILFIATVWIILSGAEKSDRLGKFDDGSAIGRIPLALGGILIGINNPFGIGSIEDNYLKEVRKNDEYFSAISGIRGAKVIYHLTAHNHFILIFAYWGIPGIIIASIIIYTLFKKSNSIEKSGSSEKLLYGTICKGTLVAYFVNAAFHNGGPFLGDYPFWYLAGIIFAIDQFEPKKEKKI